MIRSTPAIVAQGAVRRLPRTALILLCLAYILPGYFGREPWKNADITAFGYMVELASGGPHDWLVPTIMGIPPEVDALLPYWLGAWAMQLAPGWMAPDFAARLPFGLMLVLVLVATWYGIYQLARSPGAQPVAFAFGGEAQPADYARAMADGGLLGLIGCLGLAQLSHETTPALAQLCFTALTFYGLSALSGSLLLPLAAIGAGLTGLTLSGAPAVAVLLPGTGSVVPEPAVAVADNAATCDGETRATIVAVRLTPTAVGPPQVQTTGLALLQLPPALAAAETKLVPAGSGSVIVAP